MSKCVLCEKEAITTAAQIPVCAEHDREYAEEAKRGGDRPFYRRQGSGLAWKS